MTCYLPVVAPAAPRRSRTRKGNRTERPATILVVDDEQDVREVAAILLRRAGYAVVEAEGGETALERFRARRDAIDLVLLDLVMPRMRGEDVLAELLRIAPDLPVILWSGHVPEHELDTATALGGRAFLAKPFEAEQLVDLVAAVLADET